MFDFLFGEGQYGIKLVFGLIVLVALLAASFWGLRRFSRGRPVTAGGRGRQPRLAVIDDATVEGPRRLVLIRRDGVEHLMMICGPSDVVGEAHIVPAAGAAREAAPAPRPEPAVRVERPLPRPEPAPRPQRPPPPRPMAEEPPPWAAAEPEPTPRALPPRRERRPRAADPLAGLAEELSRASPGAAPKGPPVEHTRQQQPRPEPRAARPQPAPAPAQASEHNKTTKDSFEDQNLAAVIERLEAELHRRVKDEEVQPTISMSYDIESIQDAVSYRRKDAAETEALVAVCSTRAQREDSRDEEDVPARNGITRQQGDDLILRPPADFELPHASRQVDNVDCSVFAPARPERGRPILVQALLHRAEQLAAAVNAALELDPGANRRGFAKLSTKIRRRALVQLFLEMPTLDIARPLQEVTWEGEPVRVAYSVDVP